MVHPAVPRRRDGRGFGGAVVGHPAPLEAERRIDLAALGAVIAVGELVLADELAIERGPKLRAKSLTVPPGEKAQEKGFHRSRGRLVAQLAFMPAPGGE